MTDYTLTDNMYDLLQDVEFMLGKACGALQVLAEAVEEGEDNRPEGPACWFILDGLRDQQKRLAGITEGVMEIWRGERLKVVDSGEGS